MHGFTWSHNALGAAVARGDPRRLRDEGLVERSAELGATLQDDCARARGVPAVGDVRGLGMMIGVELVARSGDEGAVPAHGTGDRAGASAAAREPGCSCTPAPVTSTATNGDLMMLGPPFVLTDDDATALVERTAAAIRSVP